MNLSRAKKLLLWIILSGYPLFNYMIFIDRLPGISALETPDHIEVQESRYKEMKNFLKGEAIVGYIVDDPSRKIKTIEYESVKKIQGARYVLAPLLLDCNNLERRFIIGEYRYPGPFPEIHQADLVLIKNFGNGLALFRNKKGAP